MTFSAGMPKGLSPACLSRASRSRRGVGRMGSTVLMRNGSIGGLMSAMRILRDRTRAAGTGTRLKMP